MDISQEITLIVIGSEIILLAAIGMIILFYQKKQLWFIFKKMGGSGTWLQTIPPHHEN